MLRDYGQRPTPRRPTSWFDRVGVRAISNVAQLLAGISVFGSDRDAEVIRIALDDIMSPLHVVVVAVAQGCGPVHLNDLSGHRLRVLGRRPRSWMNASNVDGAPIGVLDPHMGDVVIVRWWIVFRINRPSGEIMQSDRQIPACACRELYDRVFIDGGGFSFGFHAVFHPLDCGSR